MNTLNTNTQIGFGSRNYPIKDLPEKAKNFVTKKGDKIFLTELEEDDDVSRVAEFVVTRIIKEQKIADEIAKKHKRNLIKEYKKSYKKNLNSKSPYTDDTTVLVGQNKNNNIIASAVITSAKNASPPLNEIFNNLPDNGLGYISKFYIDNKFQREGLGSKILKILLDSAKGRFCNVFLESLPDSAEFYKKNGFKLWVPDKYIKQRIDASVKNNPFFGNDEVSMSINLDPNRPFQEVTDSIKSSYT